jgi:hypothetical protein
LPRIALLVFLVATLPACDLFLQPGWKTEPVSAEYAGLVDQTVAVLVSADEQTLFAHPEAPAKVSRAVTARLKDHVTGVQVRDPVVISQYQKQNPYWATKPLGELMRDLQVQRVVFVDVGRYSLHEPGNAHVWRGEVQANVSVGEAEAPDPDNFVYSGNIRAVHPTDRPIGVLNSDDETMEAGVLEQFALRVSRLFYNHRVVVQ